MATITTTIGAGSTHDSDINIISSSGSGPYLVTVDDSSGVSVGDALWDEGGPPTKNLILSVVDGTTLTTAHNPSSEGYAQAEVKRYYSGSTPLTDWEAGLDSSIYSEYDNAVGVVYNDADIDDSISLNGGGGVTLTSVKLTVASDERHDGTSNSGARINYTSAGAVIDIARTGFAYEIEWLEITQSNFSPSSTQNFGIKFGQDDDPVIQNCLVYGIVGSTHNGRQAIGIGTGGSRALPQIINSMIFDIGGGTSDASGGIGIKMNAHNAAVGALNCTIHDCADVGAYGGIGVDATNLDVRNCISTDNANDDFDGTYDSKDYNLSSDTTADGANSLVSKSSSNQYVSNSGSYDLHLKSGADAIDAGTDLVATPSGVEIDIDGRDRNVQDDTWDIGADEFLATGGILNRFSAMSGGVGKNMFSEGLTGGMRE